MLKKTALTCAITLLGITSAHAAFYAGPSLSLTSNTSPNGNYRGLTPFLNVGYNDMVSACGYLALEIFGAPGSFEVSSDTPDNSNLKSTYSIGASFIPGYLITDNVLGYLRLGVVNTKFSAPNTTKAGAQFGLGMQTALTEEWHLRMEYDYATYTGANDIGAVKSDQFMLGLIYQFMY